MYRKSRIAVWALACVGFAWPLSSRAQRPDAHIDVEHYVIDAEINPRTQDLEATVRVRFQATDEEARSASFELHNGLQVSRVAGEQNEEIPFERSNENYGVRVNLPQAIPKGQFGTLSFTYRGRLTGKEESPVFGINFAAIHENYAYLMYPARWFPVSGYTSDRFTAEMNITVPSGYKALASGIGSSETTAPDKVRYSFKTTQPSFPGSIAVVQGEPSRIQTDGVSTELYFRDDAVEMARPYGESAGKVMTFLAGAFGLAPQANLAIVETESGTPNGYSAPGIVFLSPSAIGKEVNTRLLVNQFARQWWGILLSAATRNHLWITNGMARYAELQWLKDANGPGAMESEVRDNFVEALTVNEAPLIQSARLEDYSPEFWAATAGKGASIFHMLKRVMGEDAFTKLLKEFPEKYAWKSVYTDDLRATAEALSGRNLQGFFIQWVESSGAPEFTMEYTTYRTQNGFRIMGKINQDLDTFRMPVTLKIETEGNPEFKEVDVVGASSDFVADSFGKPKNIIIDPNNEVLRFDDKMRIAVAIRRGEQFFEIGEFVDALKEYQKALDVNRFSSMAHYRIGEAFFIQRNYQSAANEYREALNGDLEPKWTEVWSHIYLGKIFDLTQQRDRAVNEYNLAIRTKDNTQGAQEEAAKYLREQYQRPAQSN